MAEISIGTDSARSISASAVLGARQEELGGWTYRAAAGVTFKPNDRFSVDLDANYYRRDGWLVYQGGEISRRLQQPSGNRGSLWIILYRHASRSASPCSGREFVLTSNRSGGCP